MINWLVTARFSEATAEEKLNAISIPPPEEKHQEALDYVLDLADLPVDALRAAFEGEIERVWQEAQVEAELRESALFFNAPRTFANHLFWVRSLFWTPEQAVALSLNRNPAAISSLTLQANGAAGTAFASEYGARLYLVQQSIRAGLLGETIAPDAFIKWLYRLGFEPPPEMLNAANALNYQLTDWEAQYQALVADYNALEQETETGIARLQALEREYAAHIREQAQKIGAQADLIERLEGEIARLQAENDTPEAEKPNKSLQKIALGMAIKSYRFDPDGRRNSAVSNIVSAVVAAGFSISDDTVRELLKAAAATLMPKPKSDSKTPK
jgi:hypothetical protein